MPKKDIYDLSAEVTGCSALAHMFFNLAESWDEISKPSNEVFQDAFFALEHYLDRIADDMASISPRKESKA